MEDSEIYKNREKLYQSLMRELNLKKVDERYSDKFFGNFLVELSSKVFSIRYIMDRSFLTVDISSNFAPDNWYPLPFLKNFINKKDEINKEDYLDNLARIKELNEFLKENYKHINELLNRDNYYSTCAKLDQLIKEEFKRDHPGMIEE